MIGGMMKIVTVSMLKIAFWSLLAVAAGYALLGLGFLALIRRPLTTAAASAARRTATPPEQHDLTPRQPLAEVGVALAVPGPDELVEDPRERDFATRRAAAVRGKSLSGSEDKERRAGHEPRARPRA